MKKPWLAICWFVLWGTFQAYAVISVILGTWNRPPAFPEEAYNALIYPDMVFIPLYFTSAILLYRNHPAGAYLGLLSAGGIIYVMVYLLALSKLRGTENLLFDGIFLLLTLLSAWRIARKSAS